MADSRSLRIDFATEEVFRAEYSANIANGGIFVATNGEFTIRESVSVQIGLGFCGEQFVLEGEIVHVVPVEMAKTGATPGVAVHFQEPAAALRERFEKWLSGDDDSGEEKESPGRRMSPRAPARVRADIDEGGRTRLRGRTRNLSATGVLVSADGDPLPMGTEVGLTLSHPITGEKRPVAGRVVRHVASEDGEIAAFAIEFSMPDDECEEFARFVADVKTSEHSRRLGGINGAISEIGIENVLQMFGSCSRHGTLHITRGHEEGVIVFEGGQLRLARLGAAHGANALSAMLAWTDGRFEFEARIDEDLVATANHEPICLEAAILDAIRKSDEELRDAEDSDVDDGLLREILAESDSQAAIDEEQELDRSCVLRWCGEPGMALDELDGALRELALVGMTVGKAFAVIPEPDEEVQKAITRLIHRRLIALD